MLWKNLRLTWKIGIIIGLLLGVIFAISAMSLYNVRILDQEIQKIKHAADLDALVLAHEMDNWKWIATLQRYVYDESATTLNVQEDPRRCGFGEWYYGPERTEAEAFSPAIIQPLRSIEEAHNALHASARAIKNARDAGKIAEAWAIFENVSLPTMQTVQTIWRQVAAAMDKDTTESVLAVDRNISSIFTITMCVVIVSVLLAICIGRLIAVSITGPVLRIAGYMASVSRGDFNVSLTVRRKDELGRLTEDLKSMVSNMVSMMREVEEKGKEAERQAIVALQAQQEAQEAHEYVKLMLDAMPMGCGLWDKNRRRIDCNEAAVELFGLENKLAFLNSPLHDLFPEFQPDGRHSVELVYMHLEKMSADAEERRCLGEVVYQKPDGTPLPMEVTLVRVKYRNEYVIASYMRDLREYKAKAEEAQALQQRLEAMLDTMPFASFFFDLNENPIDCNKRAVEIFGCENKEELLKNFYALAPAHLMEDSQSREKGMEYIRSTLETGQTLLHWEHIKKDGSPLPVEVTLLRVPWKDGYRIIAYVRDLSKLVETEDNLRRILAIVDGSPNLILFLGRNNTIEYMNPALPHVSGFAREDLLKTGLALLFSPEDFQRLDEEYLAFTREQSQPINFEMPMMTADGKKYEFAFSAFGVQLHGKSGIGMLGRNITSLKQMQRDLQAAKEQTERALAQEMLYNKAKSNFLSRVSHELRTPINVIIGLTHILEKTTHTEKLDHYFVNMHSASESLLNIVNDMLDMVGLDTDNFDFTPEAFSFSKAIRQVIGNIAQQARSKDQVFTTDIDSGIHDHVFSDERRLKQILRHLLSNALRYTPENGEIELFARMLENDGNECLVRFEVSDNGIGIAQEMLERLWEVFEQEDNDINRNHDGMGLGLPLCKRIVALMKGALRVESEPGKGSRFICDVRLGVVQAEQEDDEEENRSAHEAVKDELKVDLTGSRILVVDDAPINREVLIALLEDTGAIFDEAQDGHEAVKLFLQNKYDLVLMDLHMPEMDGYDATKHIRASAQPWAKTVPIISVSAESSAELHARGQEAGISDHHAKPVHLANLLDTIAKWMRRHKRPGDPRHIP